MTVFLRSSWRIIPSNNTAELSSMMDDCPEAPAASSSSSINNKSDYDDDEMDENRRRPRKPSSEDKGTIVIGCRRNTMVPLPKRHGPSSRLAGGEPEPEAEKGMWNSRRQPSSSSSSSYFSQQEEGHVMLKSSADATHDLQQRRRQKRRHHFSFDFYSISLYIFVLFVVIAALLSSSPSYAIDPEEFANDDVHIRLRRSNIPCGSAFTPCNRRPSGFPSPFRATGANGRPLNSIHNLNSANKFSRDNRNNKNNRGGGTPVKAPNIRESMVQLATKEAKDDIDKLFNFTEPGLLRRNLVDTSETATYWNSFTRSYDYAKDLSYSAMVSIGASQRLRSFGLRTDEIIFGLPKMAIEGTVLADICPPNLIEDCVPGKYRTYSGYCNNVNRPLWGASFEPMQRYLAPDYSDEVNAPRMSGDGSPLPNARLISTQAFKPSAKRHKTVSMMLAQWAMFVYNDVAQFSTVKGADMTSLPCCNPDVSHPECLPINVSPNDPEYRGRVTCFPYARTSPAPREHCLMGPREQANMVTSYLDGSNIYGSNSVRSRALRLFVDGKLNSSRIPLLHDLLPVGSERDTGRCAITRNQGCFMSGSDHANFLPTLTSLHTLWMRQHNHLTDTLKGLNPHWDDERLYQEARRIVGAQIQHITYSEFLPIIVGKDNIQNYGLSLENNGFYSDYNLNIDSSVINSYASAAGLFFYAIFTDYIAQYSKEGSRISQTKLSRNFFNPGNLYFQDRLDSYLRFLLYESSYEFDMHMSEDLREKFLKGRGAAGLDLAALIIQMGRDNGIPSYTVWRGQCGLKKPSTFQELVPEVRDPATLDALQRMYQSIDDVDLFILGLAEKPIKGSMVGPTFSCIISKQFQKLRRGDRFWYENFFFPSAFTEQQLNEIRKTTLARVLCDNTDDIGKIQPYVFNLEDNFENCPINCNSTVIEGMNYSGWIDSEPKLHLPITKETLSKAVKLGTRMADELRQKEREILRLRNDAPVKPGDALFSHATLLSAKRESIDIARTANVLIETTKVLIRGEGLNEGEKLPKELDSSTLQQLLPQVDVTSIIGNLTSRTSDCVPQPLPCDHTTPYRTFTGWCNNLFFPRYGNAFNPVRRLLDPAYDDGFDQPRALDSRGALLPSARLVSNVVHQTRSEHHVKYTHMLMQFGQFLDHDMSLVPVSRDANDEILNCTACDEPSVNCLPIRIPASDPFFPTRNRDGSPRCIPFTRSLLGQLTLGYRNQLNQLTSFIDGSNVYGSTECDANELRLFSMGKLNFTARDEGLQEGLPQGNQEKDCRSLPRHHCFNAGDERSNEQPGLTTVHTIWLREHNRIATRLHRINNFWPDEKIYQEARRIVGAMLQHIAYTEFLPKVLGCETMAKYDLTPLKTGYYKAHDNRCDATISNAFTSAAFRFGHTLIRSEFPRMDDFFQNFSRPVQLRDSFNNVSVLYDSSQGGLDTLLIGLIGASAESFDRHITKDVRDHLFEKKSERFSGMDLPAINIQRARDHGVAPYYKYRELCGLPRPRTFNDLSDTSDEEAINSLRQAYRDVEDIDLFPGLMAERPMRGALIGPTTACILGEQFQRLRRCDRFWYENDNSETRFTPDQLAQIRKITLGKVVCQNSQFIRMVQPRVFDMPDDLLNAQVACQDLPEVDLYEWLDRQFCVVDHRVINLGKTKRITPCVACTCTAEGPECHSIRVRNCESILDEFLFSEVMDDTVCVIQCSGLIRKRAGRL